VTQNNRRPYTPPRQPVRNSQPVRRPQQAQPVRRAPAGNAPRRAPAPKTGGSSEMIWLIAVCVAMIVIALVLQMIWPNGFPLVKAQEAGNAAGSARISEIHSEGPLRINEIMTSNRTTIMLEDETTPDWIEVMNIGKNPVKLKGYSLSKTEDDAMRTFTFPDMTLEAGECVLVYADSRLRDTAGQALHAPFRISSAGDTLMLFNAGGTAIDTLNIPALGADRSYARMDVYTWQECETATPGLSNTAESYQALKKPAENSPVVISEIMSTNTKTLPDENGQYYDYIELYNRSSETVDLEGWYLTDDETQLRKWRMPQVTLCAGEYLVVYASKLDRKDDPAYLHTNFGLSSEGETLLLVDAGGRIMNSVTFDLLKANVAFSLKADGSWASGTASPGKANP